MDIWLPCSDSTRKLFRPARARLWRHWRLLYEIILNREKEGGVEKKKKRIMFKNTFQKKSTEKREEKSPVVALTESRVSWDSQKCNRPTSESCCCSGPNASRISGAADVQYRYHGSDSTPDIIRWSLRAVLAVFPWDWCANNGPPFLYRNTTMDNSPCPGNHRYSHWYIWIRWALNLWSVRPAPPLDWHNVPPRPWTDVYAANQRTRLNGNYSWKDSWLNSWNEQWIKGKQRRRKDTPWVRVRNGCWLDGYCSSM